jgi:hypothetical protein
MRRLRRIRQKRLAGTKGLGLRRYALAAGTATAIAFGSGIGIRAAPAGVNGDPHRLTVPKDSDADLMTDREEIALGYMPFYDDQNRNAVCDGSELAIRCAKAIEQLPWQEQLTDPNQTYRWCVPQYGLEICDVCGETVNMGAAGIVSPRLGLRVDCPLIATHYMAHGSFSYAGHYSGQPLHVGRLDVPSVLRALELRFPCDPNEHQLPLDYVVEGVGQLAPDANDLDGDLLADGEELAAGFDLYDADQDDDLTLDGIEIARQCATAIDTLPEYDPASGLPEPTEPYKIRHWLRGLEYCRVCGESMNMGYYELRNPTPALSINADIIALHYMSHGSFSYHGLKEPGGDLQHAGRLDIPMLLRLLEMPAKCGDLGTLYLPGDFNRDCKEDSKDFAILADRWLQSTDPNQPAEPAITYQVRDCGAGAIRSAPPESPTAIPGFSVQVDGNLVYFTGMVWANCCPDKIELEMIVEQNLITVFEKEYLTSGCRCMCSFPVYATLGPFDSGAYTIEVYMLSIIPGGEPPATHFVGSEEIIIRSGP